MTHTLRHWYFNCSWMIHSLNYSGAPLSDCNTHSTIYDTTAPLSTARDRLLNRNRRTPTIIYSNALNPACTLYARIYLFIYILGLPWNSSPLVVSQTEWQRTLNALRWRCCCCCCCRCRRRSPYRSTNIIQTVITHIAHSFVGHCNRILFPFLLVCLCVCVHDSLLLARTSHTAGVHR